ncbi:MAG TPA: sensor histidine kinase [Actinomycetes bacterium]|nr:sensor histidine kinase [Actinomycetes bacterium]
MDRRASPVARLLERNPVAGDWLLAAVATLLAVAQRLAPAQDRGGPLEPTALGLLLVVAGNLPVAWRRRFPLGVLAVTELVVLVHLALGFGLWATGPGLIIALYTVASVRPRRVSGRIAVALIVVNTAVVVVRPLLVGGPLGDNMVVPALLLAGSWAVGDSVRTRRAYTAGLEERALRLERDREERAVRAVAEERARIARELHDVVAHHVSVIAVQAGAAEEEARTDPARETLGLIQSTSRQVLAELRALLGVLRTGEAAPHQDPALAPQPSLRELDRLVAQSRAAGLPVELVITGEPRALPAIVDLAAYRIVQEALTNTRRHAGPARARVEVRYGRDALELEITDDGRGAAAGEPDGGRGLIGMRERVALVGGVLEAGPWPGGGFRVAAVLPTGDAP